MAMKYNVNDTIRIVTDDTSGYGKNYIGKITNVDDDTEDSTVYYEVDGRYEYYESEIELVKPHRLQVKLKPLTDTAVIPKYATVGSACFDICSDEDIIVSPGQTVAVSTGLSFELPEGYQMKVLPRSGLSVKTPLRIVIGTVDEDYRGEVKVILWHTGKPHYMVRDYCKALDGGIVKTWEQMNVNNYFIRKGDRIAQAEVVPVIQVDFAIVDELSKTVRGEGGFGHSGV